MILHDSVVSLLRAHGLPLDDEVPFAHAGFSGARLTRIARDDGVQFILKRMTIAHDWIMRATNDESCREVQFALAGLELASVRTPNVGVALDGSGYALLMHDITPDLLPDGALTYDRLAIVMDAMANLHRVPVSNQLVGRCDLEQRLTLLTPRNARVAASYGATVGAEILRGWKLFRDLASPRAVLLVEHLFEDTSGLVRALGRMNPSLLHGDLKFDNIGLRQKGGIWLIDWALTLIAPPAVELGWFLAVNSRRLPVSLDQAMSMYAEASDLTPSSQATHDGLTVLCGLILRGWRKALDAEAGEPGELQWWCSKAESAAALL